MAEKMGPSHEGHRQRMKERYLANGLNGFAGHEVLELLLYYAIPYKNTNSLGHTLEDAFGGLSNVLEADYRELLKVPGVTPHIATLLSLCGDVARRYNREITGMVTHLHNTDALMAYVRPLFYGQREEMVVLVSMDNKQKLLNTTQIFTGDVNSSNFHPRTIVQQALRDNATRIALAHNHPNGFALPSRQDWETTYQLLKVLAPLEIQLIDHLVVAEDECLSMAELPETRALFKAE